MITNALPPFYGSQCTSNRKLAKDLNSCERTITYRIVEDGKVTNENMPIYVGMQTGRIPSHPLHTLVITYYYNSM